MTRKFSSYGPVDTNLHYYAPRKELIEKTYVHLTDEHIGHYITVWGSRQTRQIMDNAGDY